MQQPLFPPFPLATPPPIPKSSCPSSCTLQPFAPTDSTSDSHPVITEKTPTLMNNKMNNSRILDLAVSHLTLKTSHTFHYDIPLDRFPFCASWQIKSHTYTQTITHKKQPLPFCLSCEDAPQLSSACALEIRKVRPIQSYRSSQNSSMSAQRTSSASLFL